MGFLNSIFNMLSEDDKAKAKEAASSAKDFLKTLAEKASAAAAAATSSDSVSPSSGGRGYAPGYFDSFIPQSLETTRGNIRSIIQSEFPAFNLRAEVPVQELAGDVEEMFQLYTTRPTQAYRAEWGMPYTYVLEQGGVPKGVVMIAEQRRSASNVKFLISRMYAKKMGLPFISFYAEMPNKSDYVSTRIRNLMSL